MENLLIIGSNILTAAVAWFFGKKKRSAETDNIILQNLETSIMIYQEIISDLKVQIQELNKKVTELEEKIDELHEENKRLKNSL